MSMHQTNRYGNARDGFRFGGNFCSNPRYNGISHAAEKSTYVPIKILDFVEDHFRRYG